LKYSPASLKFAKSPAPDSTLTEKPFLAKAAVTAGVAATLFSPVHDSFGIPILSFVYGTPKIGSAFFSYHKNLFAIKTIIQMLVLISYSGLKKIARILSLRWLNNLLDLGISTPSC